jgi:ketosteroid isomerase-like protein
VRSAVGNRQSAVGEDSGTNNDRRRDVLMEVYRAFNARDIDAVLNHLAPDVDWPNGMTGGREHGRAAVRSYWERQWREIDPRVEPMQIDFDADGNAHVRVHQLIKSRDGAVLEDRKIEHVYAFDGPFIGRMNIVEADPDPETDEDEDEDAAS